MQPIRFNYLMPDGRIEILTMQPGETIERTFGGPDDEGYSRTWLTIKCADGRITVEEYTDGRDCDGRVTSHARYWCPFADLAAHRIEGCGEDLEGIPLPKWQHGKSEQRDYAAEAAGY